MAAATSSWASTTISDRIARLSASKGAAQHPPGARLELEADCYQLSRGTLGLHGLEHPRGQNRGRSIERDQRRPVACCPRAAVQGARQRGNRNPGTLRKGKEKASRGRDRTTLMRKAAWVASKQNSAQTTPASHRRRQRARGSCADARSNCSMPPIKIPVEAILPLAQGRPLRVLRPLKTGPDILGAPGVERIEGWHLHCERGRPRAAIEDIAIERRPNAQPDAPAA